ncbi:MAG: hypothetical protein ACSLE6_00505 [Mycobacterium sp.]
MRTDRDLEGREIGRRIRHTFQTSHGERILSVREYALGEEVFSRDSRTWIDADAGCQRTVDIRNDRGVHLSSHATLRKDERGNSVLSIVNKRAWTAADRTNHVELVVRDVHTPSYGYATFTAKTEKTVIGLDGSTDTVTSFSEGVARRNTTGDELIDDDHAVETVA